MKVCSKQGCPELTVTQFCEEHTVRSHGWHTSTRVTPRDWARTRKKVLRRARYRCKLCNANASEVDHLVPSAWGGSEGGWNLRAICSNCHKKKTLEEAALGRKRAKMSSQEWMREVDSFLDRWIA